MLNVNHEIFRATSRFECELQRLTGQWPIVLTSSSHKAAWLLASRYGWVCGASHVVGQTADMCCGSGEWRLVWAWGK